MALLGTLSFDTKLNAQAVKDAETIKKQVLHKLGNSIPLKLKVTFTSKDLRSDLQSQLSKFKPKVKVDIVVDQASASAAVQQALAKAGLMNNMTAGQLRAQRAAEIQQRMQLALARAQREAASAARDHSKSLLTLNSHFGNGITLGGKFSATVASIYSVYTLKNFMQSMIEIGGEFQKQRIALETMLGSLSKADVMYKRMKELAVESPFTFMDLMSYTKQLKAFQIPYNELFETTKRLGDISAGLGVDMNRLILAFGQVRAAAFLRGQEVRQFTEAGIPLVDALAKKFSELENRAVSAGEVFDKISKRQVSFGMVKDVLWELTDEGGQFYNMQSKLTESLSGKLDKLRDSYQIMVAEMAQGNNAVLGGMLDMFTKLVQYGDKVIGMLGTLTGALLIYKAAIIAINAIHAVQGFVGAMKMTTGVLNIGRAMQGLTLLTWRQVAAQQALNLVSNANWIALIAASIVAVTGTYLTFREETDSLAKSTRELRAEIQEEFEAMDEMESKGQELIRTMFNQAKTTDQQKAAYERLQALYPNMFKNMDFEQAKRKSNIELLKMETQAARDAMQAKLNERIADAKARLAAAKARNEQYNTQDESKKNILNSILSKGSDEDRKKFEEEAQKVQNDYVAVLDELDELKKLQEEVNKRSENASSNRTSKWWNAAKKLAGEFASYAPKEDATLEEYQEIIAKQLNSRKGFLDSLTENAENYADVKKEVDTLTNIYTAIGGKTDSLSKFKPKGGGKDPLLDEYKTRLDSLEKFKQAYERYANEYTKEDAINLAEKLFPDFKGKGKEIVDNYRDLLLELSKISGNDNRKKFSNLVLGKVSAIDAEELKKQIDNAMNEVNKYIQSQSEKYDLYKKIIDATGNRTHAATIAFGNNISFDNFAEELRKKIQDAISKMDKAKGVSIDELLLKDDKGLKEIGIFEKGLDGVYKMLKKLREEEQKLKAEDVDLFIEALKNAKSLETELAQIDMKYERAREAIKKQGGDQTLIDNTYKNQNEEKAKAQWEWFKKNNEDWGRIFSNLDNISTQTLKSMLDKLRDVAPSIRDSVEATKALYEAMDKIQDQLYERNPFAALGDYFSRMSAFREFAPDLKGSKRNDTIYIDAERANKMGLSKDKKGWRGTVSQFYDAMHKTEKGFSKIVSGIGKTFDALQDVMEPVVKMFKALGNEDLSNFFSIGNDALGAAANFSNGLSQLSDLFPTGKNGEQNPISQALGAAGPYGAAAAAGLSIVTSLFAMHDAALQEEIEASQARQKEMENLTKNLEKVLERTLGGIYNTSASKDMINALKVERTDIGAQALGLLFGGGPVDINGEMYKGFISKDTIQAIKEAEETSKYYDAYYASLLAQRDELQHQLESEMEKKESDADKIADYKQQLTEMEDQIEYFARDLAETLYGIDVKGWAEELGDALFEAWQKGEDGADAFRRKASEIMADVAKNIAVTKLIETAMEDVLKAVTSEMKRTKGLLDEQSLNVISEEMAEVSSTLPQAFNTLMDGLNEGIKRAGLTDMKELADDSSSGSTNAIGKAITEQDTSLWASYWNAMRADISVIRETENIHLPAISVAVQRASVLAETQVTLQQQIAANTLRNADAADKIYDIMHRIDTGVTKIRMA